MHSNNHTEKSFNKYYRDRKKSRRVSSQKPGRVPFKKKKKDTQTGKRGGLKKSIEFHNEKALTHQYGRSDFLNALCAANN
jgi:hypothetical protein